jgi:hypothetical protein
VSGDVAMQNLAAFVLDDEEAVEQLEGHCTVKKSNATSASR